MIPSNNCYETIKRFEGLSLNAYLDSVRVWTIGYGCTYYENGTPVRKGDKITRKRAESLFKFMVDEFGRSVARYITSKVNQNQFDAAVSLAYNIGLEALKNSTLLKKVNTNPNDQSIYEEFRRWNKGTINGKKVALPGLTLRRKLEADLYFKLPAYSNV